MDDWNNLYPGEKQKLLDRAKDYLDKGFYQGFSIEELAILLHKKSKDDHG